jgi:hypothetical protein
LLSAGDRFHFKNHIGAWCHKHTNPHTFTREGRLKGNTEVCEQLFRFINRFKFSMRGMNKTRFRAALLKIVEMNHRELMRKRRQ